MKETIIIDLCKEDLDNHIGFDDPNSCLLACGIRRATGSLDILGNVHATVKGTRYNIVPGFYEEQYQEAVAAIKAGGTYRVELIPDQDQ